MTDEDTNDTDEIETFEVDIPPEATPPADVPVMPPEPADDPMSWTWEEHYGQDPGLFFEDIQVRDAGLGKNIHLVLDAVQARRWIDLMEKLLHERHAQLADRYAEVDGLFTVTVEEYPPGTPASRTDDLDPITSRTIANCWTERDAQAVRSAVLHGDHPDFDPMDFDRGDYFAQIQFIPLLQEDDVPDVWSDD